MSSIAERPLRAPTRYRGHLAFWANPETTTKGGPLGTALDQVCLTGEILEPDARAFCAAIIRSFIDGQLDDIDRFYTYPLAVYSPAGLRLELTPEDTRKALFLRRAAALNAGMVTVNLVIHEIGDRSLGRFPISLQWDYIGPGSQVIGTSILRYFCRVMPDNQISIEMLEFLQLAFPTAAQVWTPGNPH